MVKISLNWSLHRLLRGVYAMEDARRIYRWTHSMGAKREINQDRDFDGTHSAVFILKKDL